MEITIAGKQCRASNQRAFTKLESFVENNYVPDDASELSVREVLLPFVEGQLGPSEWILYDGNSVWDVKRLMKQFKTFVKYYDYEHFTKYLYEFFSLQCGSIAHYNKMGWFQTYPDLISLKEFFKANEYGQAVKDYPPSWHWDAQLAVDQMSTVLFGLDTRARYPRY